MLSTAFDFIDFSLNGSLFLKVFKKFDTYCAVYNNKKVTYFKVKAVI